MKKYNISKEDIDFWFKYFDNKVNIDVELY